MPTLSVVICDHLRRSPSMAWAAYIAVTGEAASVTHSPRHEITPSLSLWRASDDINLWSLESYDFFYFTVAPVEDVFLLLDHVRVPLPSCLDTLLRVLIVCPPYGVHIDNL